jgi:hypothetical protein
VDLMKRMLGLIILIFLASLFIGCDGVVPPPSEPWEEFIGIWKNIDPNANTIPKVKISETKKNLVIEVWGKCEPEDCYWGEKIIEKTSAENGMLEITWEPGYCIRDQELSLIGEQLEVKTKTHFIDGSGRLDYEWIVYLQK